MFLSTCVEEVCNCFREASDSLVLLSSDAVLVICRGLMEDIL